MPTAVTVNGITMKTSWTNGYASEWKIYRKKTLIGHATRNSDGADRMVWRGHMISPTGADNVYIPPASTMPKFFVSITETLASNPTI